MIDVLLTYSPGNHWAIEAVNMSAYDPSDETDNPLDADATVQVTLRGRNGGDEVAGQTWPLALAYRDDGEFYAVLPPDLDVDPRQRYEAVIEGDDGDGSDFEWVRPVQIIDPRRGGD